MENTKIDVEMINKIHYKKNEILNLYSTMNGFIEDKCSITITYPNSLPDIKDDELIVPIVKKEIISNLKKRIEEKESEIKELILKLKILK